MARVLLFGRLSDLAGWRERSISAADTTALLAALTAEDPTLGEALAGKGVQIAVDQAITRATTALNDNTEVAFLPPMSGG